MSNATVYIDDDEIKQLMKKVSPRQLAGVIARSFNQSMTSTANEARKQLRQIGVSAKAAKPLFKGQGMGGMIVRDQVSVRQAFSSGIPEPEILFRQGRRANVGLKGVVSPWLERKKQIGVKVKLKKLLRVRGGFVIKNKVLVRKDGDLKSLKTPSDKHYAQSAKLITNFYQTMPAHARIVLKKRLYENLTFMVSKNESQQGDD
jgi:hypothetical protein